MWQLEVESSRVLPIKKLCYHSGAGISTGSWRIGHAECSVLNSLRKKLEVSPYKNTENCQGVVLTSVRLNSYSSHGEQRSMMMDIR